MKNYEILDRKPLHKIWTPVLKLTASILTYYVSVSLPLLNEEVNWPLLIGLFCLAILIRSFSRIETRLIINEEGLEIGTFIPFRKSLKNKEVYLKTDYALELIQNKDKFFEIYLSNNKKVDLLVRRDPNRKPILQYLKKMESAGWKTVDLTKARSA